MGGHNNKNLYGLRLLCCILIFSCKQDSNTSAVNYAPKVIKDKGYDLPKYIISKQKMIASCTLRLVPFTAIKVKKMNRQAYRAGNRPWIIAILPYFKNAWRVVKGRGQIGEGSPFTIQLAF